jgi:hypothetical protein
VRRKRYYGATVTYRESRYRRWMLREWRCCGGLWQVLVSTGFRRRRDLWRPQCDRCGDAG